MTCGRGINCSLAKDSTNFKPTMVVAGIGRIHDCIPLCRTWLLKRSKMVMLPSGLRSFSQLLRRPSERFWVLSLPCHRVKVSPKKVSTETTEAWRPYFRSPRLAKMAEWPSKDPNSSQKLIGFSAASNTNLTSFSDKRVKMLLSVSVNLSALKMDIGSSPWNSRSRRICATSGRDPSMQLALQLQHTAAARKKTYVHGGRPTKMCVCVFVLFLSRVVHLTCWQMFVKWGFVFFKCCSDDVCVCHCDDSTVSLHCFYSNIIIFIAFGSKRHLIPEKWLPRWGWFLLAPICRRSSDQCSGRSHICWWKMVEMHSQKMHWS